MDINNFYPKIPQATELRIGNILLDEDRHVVKIERINSDRIHEYVIVSKDEGNIYPSNVYKIPITAEWLTQLGFKYAEQNRYCIKFDNMRLMISIEDFKICLWSRNLWCISLKECYFVSDLQNLFFAFAGIELKLKNNDTEILCQADIDMRYGCDNIECINCKYGID